tara:strand:+ start:28 stop:750 length:723 start_codon:yes stop_codon:yes gene_type:complete
MSAYNPPTQNQSIFNPNNYGSSISTLADSAYDEITATLGNFTTLFIGTDNVATTLNTKQDTITNSSLTIARTNGLQDALDTIPLVYFASPSNYSAFVVSTSTLNQTYFEYTFTGIDLPFFDYNTEKLVLDLNGSLGSMFATTPTGTDLKVVVDIKSNIDSYSAVLNTRDIYAYKISSAQGVITWSERYSPIIRILHDITETIILSTITFRVLVSTTSTSTSVNVSGTGNPATLSIYKTEA